MEKIGFIGLGIMGRPMASNLLRAGYEILVNDVSEKAVAAVTENFPNAVYASAAEIGEKCDIVFTILPSGAIVKSVLFGENGVAGAAKAGSLVVDMSSVTPGESRECSENLGKLGIAFLDSPVSGGESGAIEGSLAFMVGGNEKDFDRVKPYFEVMGASATLVGGPGSGSVAKLTNQVIVNLTIAAVSEGFVLAAKAGADPEKVWQAIRGGLAASAVLDSKAPKMMDRDFVPGGKISINRKDMGNVLSAAHELDVPAPLSAQIYEIMQSLKVAGQMDEDHASIVKYFERLAGCEVKRGGMGNERRASTLFRA